MIAKIAWKNIWRNKIRSTVLLLAIVIGLVGGLFATGLSNGLTVQRINDYLRTMLAHIQIHNDKYAQDPQLKYILENPNQVFEQVMAHPEVVSASKKVLIEGMASSSRNTAGIMIHGIFPDLHKQVFDMHEMVINGHFLEDSSQTRNPILIGTVLAETLDVGVGSKIVINFQNLENDIISAAFRVEGIFKTTDKSINQGDVFVLANDIHQMLGSEIIHQISVYVKDRNQASAVGASLADLLNNVSVREWKELSPELAYLFEFSGTTLFIYMGIILIGLGFGIVNTMLMAVLERVKELGMLMAVGMNRLRIFGMILFESIFLSLSGALLGILVGMGIVQALQENGLSLSAFSEGMSSLGFSDVVYPQITLGEYISTGLLVLGIAILSAIYPAIKALRLKPSEALSSI